MAEKIEKAISTNPEAEKAKEIEAIKASSGASLDDLKLQVDLGEDFAKTLGEIQKQTLTEEERLQKIDEFLANKSPKELRKIAKNKNTPAGKRAQELLDALDS